MEKIVPSVFDLYNNSPDQWQHTLLEFRFFYERAGESPCGLDFSAGCRFGLLFRWKYPHYIWYLPLILCGIASSTIAKSLAMGICCIAAMLALPIVDFSGIKKAARKTYNPQVENVCEK